MLPARETLQLIQHATVLSSVRKTAVSSVVPGFRKISTTSQRHKDASTSSTPQNSAATSEAWLFVDSVFPVRLGVWDLRHYIGYLREETLLDRLKIVLSSVKTHDFKILSLEPHPKDGGVFVNFAYKSSQNQNVVDEIVQSLHESVVQSGGVPSWYGLPKGNIWLVKGTPWREDLSRFASPILKVSFDGPDLQEESLYELLRPYGHIQELTPPSPAPAGTLRSTTVAYSHVRSATIARNTIHGLTISPSTSLTTRLRTGYLRPIQAHAVKDYVASHPRIFLPILFFLVGTLTYTVFDPLRVLMVEGKISDWFDYREYHLFKWLQKHALDRFSIVSMSAGNAVPAPVGSVWKERRDAENTLHNYLTDRPNTIAFIHGPQGSGKSRMLDLVMKQSGRKVLTIDVDELIKTTSDTALVTGLAHQTGYWPVFSFLNSVNNLIDLASVGLIGQKAGLSTSLADQLKQILTVVATGLGRVNLSHRLQQKREAERAHVDELRKVEDRRIHQLIAEGRWHDGRLDCVAGNGIMSELGVGDELFTQNDIDAPSGASKDVAAIQSESAEDQQEVNRKQRSVEDMKAIEGIPAVVIQNFNSKGGGAKKAELLDVLAQWAASLAENKIAHIIVVSDNREDSKQLAKALPSKPLTVVTLSDADNASALSFVKQKLHDVDVDVEFTRHEISYVQRLGGRASDLESLIHKVRNGQNIQEAVEDIITRGVGELRKNAFGDDSDDAKSLPWSREQVWVLMKQLSKIPEVPYHEVLIDFPFKGDETPLRNMERAELITIGTYNGRPSTIKPGKPVYRYVFERLVKDSIFQATQDIAYNEKVIAATETIVKSCEDELTKLMEIEAGTSRWWGSRTAVSKRGEYLLHKMREAQRKIEKMDAQNISLKKTLSN